MGKAPLYRLYVCLPRPADIPEGRMEYRDLLALYNHLLGEPSFSCIKGAHFSRHDGLVSSRDLLGWLQAETVSQFLRFTCEKYILL